MEHLLPHPARTPRRRAWAWAPVCASLLLLPTLASSQECPVPKAELDGVWQSAYAAYENNDCVRFVLAAARYYGLVHHSTFSWDTVEIGRAYDHCVRVLDSALVEADLLRKENADLRRRLDGGGSVAMNTYGQRAERPSLRGRPPHDLP